MSPRAWVLLSCFAVAGCYSPNPKDKGFKCTAEQGLLCPDGLVCDVPSGLCIKPGPMVDFGPGDIGTGFDGTVVVGPRTCDERVQQGAFSGLTNLGALNTSGSESNITLTPDGKRIYYIGAAGTLMTADLPTPKAPGAPVAVTLTAPPTTLRGGSILADGSYAFAGASAGTTNVFIATRTAVDQFTVGAGKVAATTPCTFSNPVFLDGVSTKELYMEGPLGDCTNAAGQLLLRPDVMMGLLVNNFGTFTKPVADTNLGAPFLLPGGLTLVMSSNNSRLVYAGRPSITPVSDWMGPSTIPMKGIGDPSVGDHQAVVAPGCATLYLVATRAGGKGGSDIWAADIAAQ